MIDQFLSRLIPEDNLADLRFAHAAWSKPDVMAALYDYAPAADRDVLRQSRFIGVFIDADTEPQWARRAARYLHDQFTHEAQTRVKLFGDVLPSIADDGAGKCLVNFRHAMDLWEAGGRQGVEPYTAEQDYGSCVDASVGEHECSLFGWRAVRLEFREEWRHSSAWYKYAERGYCSDGWNGSGAATAAYKVGCAFRIPYAIGGNSVDFNGDDENERIVARTWCRSGVPSWLKSYTLANHAYEDGAITRFQGGVKELRAAFAAGGVIHTSGTRTSGGSRPFTIGSVGPHMQSAVGCDDSDEFRKFCREAIGVTPRADDFPVVLMQTWGKGWRGECADAYWPTWWGRKPQGAWVWWASDVIKRLSCDYVWLPRVKGFPASNPPPPPPPSGLPRIDGVLQVNGPVIAGVVTAATDIPAGTRFTSTPAGAGQYRLEPLIV
jgi:hypothetical protein